MYTHLNAEMEPRENNHHKSMRLYIKTVDASYNDVELGIDLNEKEVTEFGAGMASMMEDGSFFEFIEQLKSAFKKTADEQEEEKSEEPEEKATDEERCIECYTFCDVTSNREKAILVRAWLNKKGIKYEIDPIGIKKYTYKLTPAQIIELQGYLLDNDISSYEANI